MEASKIDKPYPDWRNAVAQHLHENYCITIEDAGIDEAYLINQWQSNQAPFDFVEWFGGKYDLDGKPSFAQAHEQDR
jgi:hypothetical protein